MGDQVLTLTDLTVGIRQRPILSNVSLNLAAGAWYGLVGPNGCGKTTLMRASLGLLRPTTGTVRLCGAAPPYRAGWVAASFGPRLAHPRRRAHTELWLRISALGGNRADLDTAWAETGLPDKQVCCGDLSLGQAQRLAIVTALVNRPRLVILDEPTVGLDAASVGWLRHRLREFVTDGGCVWVSSHDLDEVEHSADQIAVLSGGSLAYAGSVAGLIGNRSHTVQLRSTDPERLKRVLSTAGTVFVHNESNNVTVYGCDAASLGGLLATHQVPLLSMTTPQVGLQTVLDDLYATAHGRDHAELATSQGARSR
jgi:ABC-2 type transport system ATP-binding protein